MHRQYKHMEWQTGLRSDTDNLNVCSLSFCVAETLRGSEGAWSLWQPFSPPRGFCWSSPCLGHCWPPGQWEEQLHGDGRFDFGGQHLLHVFICFSFSPTKSFMTFTLRSLVSTWDNLRPGRFQWVLRRRRPSSIKRHRQSPFIHGRWRMWWHWEMLSSGFGSCCARSHPCVRAHVMCDFCRTSFCLGLFLFGNSKSKPNRDKRK